MALAPHRFKFRLEDYYALHDMGLFADRHVELWDGDIIEMTVNPPHALAIMRLHKLLERYARHKIQEYWVADIKNEQWFVYRKPASDSYEEELRYAFTEAFAPLAFSTPSISQARVWLEPR